jgi:3-deoxy-7-phosphoheptulonate synthase
LSWIAIGARSSEDQEHRIHASSLDCPVGIKNPTHGSIKIGVNGVIAAQHSHTALFDGDIIETSGNDYAHLVLRGGNAKTNYDIESLEESLFYLTKGNVKNPSVIVDVSHDNCIVNGKKESSLQGEIALKVFDSVQDKPHLKKLIKGFMLESFIKNGNQIVKKGTPIDMGGLSITDPCLGWVETEGFILKLAAKI